MRRLTSAPRSLRAASWMRTWKSWKLSLHRSKPLAPVRPAFLANNEKWGSPKRAPKLDCEKLPRELARLNVQFEQKFHGMGQKIGPRGAGLVGADAGWCIFALVK